MDGPKSSGPEGPPWHNAAEPACERRSSWLASIRPPPAAVSSQAAMSAIFSRHLASDPPRRNAAVTMSETPGTDRTGVRSGRISRNIWRLPRQDGRSSTTYAATAAPTSGGRGTHQRGRLRPSRTRTRSRPASRCLPGAVRDLPARKPIPSIKAPSPRSERDLLPRSPPSSGRPLRQRPMPWVAVSLSPARTNQPPQPEALRSSPPATSNEAMPAAPSPAPSPTP